MGKIGMVQLGRDLSIQSRQRLRVTLEGDIQWPSIRQKLQDFCEKKGWGNCKVQYVNSTALLELCDPSSLRRYLELHSKVLVGDTATLPLCLVPDPTDGPSSFTTEVEEIVLEVDQEGLPVLLTLDSDILLGEGGFGTVRRARNRETQIEYAVKTSFQDEMSQKHMKTEIYTLLQLTHPHIISVLQHGCVLDPVNGRLPAYMMDLGRCSVQALLQTGWHNKAAAEAAQRDVTSALQQVHAAGLGHMDVKPGNWLVTNKFIAPDGATQLELKLIDAGGAGRLDKDSVTSFTAEYAHPIHRGEGSTHTIVRYAQAFLDWYGLHISIFQLTNSDSDRVSTPEQVLERASETLASDKEFVLQAVQENGFALQFACEELQSDKEVVIKAVRQHGYALRFACETLKSDKEVVIEAIKQRPSSLTVASKTLRNDKEVVMEAVRQDGSALEYASKMLCDDKEVVMAAVRHDGSALEYASKTLRNDEEVVMEAVRQDGSALEYASKTLRNHQEVVMEAVRQDGSALEYADKRLRSDKEFVTTAVRADGCALEHADTMLRSDKEVVMEAVQQDGSALEYASKTLRDDKEVVMAAVWQDGSALEYASETLQSDEEIMALLALVGG
eukprot:s215_g6.t1